MNIILAHGILGFDKVLGIEYFNGIKSKLATSGMRITPMKSGIT